MPQKNCAEATGAWRRAWMSDIPLAREREERLCKQEECVITLNQDALFTPVATQASAFLMHGTGTVLPLPPPLPLPNPPPPFRAGSSWAACRAPVLCLHCSHLRLELYIWHYLIVFLTRPHATQRQIQILLPLYPPSKAHCSWHTWRAPQVREIYTYKVW